MNTTAPEPPVVGPDRGRWGRGALRSNKVVATVLHVGVLSIVARLVAALRDLLIARKLGTTVEVDAYLVALVVPTFAISVLAGAFTSAIIPTYVRVRDAEGPAAARRLIESGLVLMLGLLLVASALLATAGRLVVQALGPGFSDEVQDLTWTLFLTLVPMLLLSGIAACYVALLNAEGRFGLAAAAPVLTPVVPAVLLLTGTVDIHALALATTAGAALEAAVLAVAVARRGLPVLPRWQGRDEHLRRMTRQYLPMVAGAALLSSNLLVDQAFASTLGPGSVASLIYGSKVTFFVMGIGTLALGTAFLPYFSTLAAARQWSLMASTLRAWTWRILLAGAVAAGLLIALSSLIIRALFLSEEFTSSDAVTVTFVQQMSLLQIPFHLAGVLVVRAISSLRANTVLMWGAVISVTTNALLNYVLVMALGVAGLALATSLVYTLSFCLLYAYLTRQLRIRDRSDR